MKYYLITTELANILNVSSYRKGDKDNGYIVTSGDLAAYGIAKALKKGAKEITTNDAISFIKKIEK